MSLLSNRQARRALVISATTQVRVNTLLVEFLTRGFFGRMKWLVCGR